MDQAKLHLMVQEKESIYIILKIMNHFSLLKEILADETALT